MPVSKPPIVDREALLAVTEGNWELLADLVELFRIEGPRLMGEMHDAVTAGDAPRLRRAAHTLAGNARTFAAPDLADLARDVERLALAGEIPAAGERLPEMEIAVAGLSCALVELVNPLCREAS